MLLSRFCLLLYAAVYHRNSFLEFGRACHRVAQAVRPNRAGPEGKIVALIANTDTILYQALIAGMVRVGCGMYGIYILYFKLIQLQYCSHSQFRRAAP